MINSKNAPVPYVLFKEPGSKQHWPTVADCWSPIIPVTNKTTLFLDHMSKSSEQSFTSGMYCSGILSISKICLSHLLLVILNNIVLLALEASVK